MADDLNYKFATLDYMVVMFYFICLFGAISHVLLIIAFIKDPLKCFLLIICRAKFI